MFKLKLMTAILTVAGLLLFLMGGTYFTATGAIVCMAMALPLTGYLAWRWLLPHDHSRIPFILWVPVSELPTLYAFKDLGVLNVPLGATIEPDKVTSLGGFIALTSTITILLAVIIPTSPTCDDDED